jgi:co-chaperonin GroES (HSP10)
MSGLLLPKTTIAQMRKQAEEATAQNIKASAIHRMDSDDFIDPAGVAQQLAQLRAYIDARRAEEPNYHLPKPSGWRLQVLMLTIPETSAGGIIVVDDAREQRSMASPQGVILSMGPACYSDPKRFTVNGVLTPWHKVGDRIQFVKYDAQMFQIANGQRLGILTDTQPVATIDEGWEVPQ